MLYVVDLKRSVDFYTGGLLWGGVPPAAGSANDQDLGLFEAPNASPSGAGRSSAGLYHLPWEVDTVGALS